MNQIPTVLVVDDDQSMCFILQEAFKKEKYNVHVVKSGEEALKLASKISFDVITLDIKMPDMDGFEVITKLKQINPDHVIVIVTAYGAEKVAIEAIQKGAYDYFTKPFDLETLRVVIRRAIEKNRLDLENRTLRDQIKKRYDFKNIIGKSSKMLEVFELMSKLINTDVTVLILGESGTGKELVSRAIHYNSPRRDKPFIKINCAAIPDTLLESELFGHEKGAFTDAAAAKPGKFELAHGGTLFLDEIGDMSAATQSKLLRVLQEKEIERLGGTKPIKVNVRIIVATNKNLTQTVKDGEFREDLYYRINVVSINLPPLRQRREDIPYLIDYFLANFNAEFHRNIKNISVDAMELLMKYNWPGNVRELENVLQRAILVADKDTIIKECLPMYLRSMEKESYYQKVEHTDFTQPLNDIVKEVVCDIEKQLILQALNKTNWNRTHAAELLKISRKSLFNKIKQYDIYDKEDRHV
ncbi:MAG: sigma-54 dependent transcriptional regulator [Candidatus Omnitrophota bacterium]